MSSSPALTPLPEATRARVARIHAAAAAKQARDPVALDVHALSSFTDALYICHGDSTRAVEALVEAVLAGLDEPGIARPRVEGRRALQWVLIDAGDVMVHVFVKDRREYYQLERLWHDAPRLGLEAA